MKKTPKFSDDEIRKVGQLWVTSIAGTALVIVIQSIGEDWLHWAIWPKIQWLDIDWGFTADRVVRYLIAIWFGTYLVLAYLANEARPDPSWLGIGFDIAQSILVFGVFAALGFVTQNFDLFSAQLYVPLASAFAAIAFIALGTLLRHLRPPRTANWCSLQIVRAAVTLVALLAIWYLVCLGPRSTGVGRDWLGTLAFVLLSFLGLYIYSVFAFQVDKDR